VVSLFSGFGAGGSSMVKESCVQASAPTMSRKKRSQHAKKQPDKGQCWSRETYEELLCRGAR
jgi:hypothetical protein